MSDRKGICYRYACNREAHYWILWRAYPDKDRACSAHGIVARDVATVVPIEDRRNYAR